MFLLGALLIGRYHISFERAGSRISDNPPIKDADAELHLEREQEWMYSPVYEIMIEMRMLSLGLFNQLLCRLVPICEHCNVERDGWQNL